MTALGDFSPGDVLTAADLNQLNNVTALELTGIFAVPSGTTQLVTFGSGTETIDVSGWHSISTNSERITPNIAGYYYASAWVRWNESALNVYQIELRKNTSAEALIRLNLGNYPAAGVSKVIYLNGSTDYVALAANTSSGVTRYIYRAGVSLTLLRAA